MNQKGFTTFSSHERGLTPILIVILLAAALVGGYLVYKNQPKPTPSSTPSDASPTPKGIGETANWKTYTNTKYGFEIKYPEKATVEEKDNYIAIIVTPGVAFSVGSGSIFDIIILDNPQSLILEDVHKNYLHWSCNTEYGGKCEHVILNGYKALKVSGADLFAREVFYLQKGQVVFHLRWSQGGEDKEEQEIGDQILSTFRFLP